MVRRFIKTLAVVIAVLCVGCAGTMGSSYFGTSGSASTGAALGEVSGTPENVGDRNIQDSFESWNTRCWRDRGSNFGANSALGSSVPPGFNCPGGGGDVGE